jgi:hypothetical protein
MKQNFTIVVTVVAGSQLSSLGNSITQKISLYQ